MMKLSNVTGRLATLGSDKWQVHIEGRHRAARGEALIFLSIGEPDALPPAAVMDEADAAMRRGRTRYAHGQGEPGLRQALAAKYSKRTGRAITPEQFIYTSGTQTGLFTAMMTTVEDGAEVLMADPYYATYEGVIAAAGGTPVPIPADPDHGFHLRASQLEKAITPKSKVLLLNTPSNPTGAVLSQGEVRAIGDICKAHGLWIVSDEVYADMTYGNTVFASPFDEADLEERTIVVSSLSKSHAMPGFRAGWIAASEAYCAAAMPFCETMMFGAQPFLQDAAAFAIENHFPEVDAQKRAYERRAQALVAGLEAAPSIAARMPEGGMFVMVDVRKTGLSGEAFARRLLAEEGVVTMPGESFGQGGSGHIRLALTVDEAEIAEACRRIAALAGRVATNRMPA
jgi:arginine:pyruvate transaminase